MPRVHRLSVVNYPRIVLFVAGVYLCLQFFDAIARALLLFFFAFLFATALNVPVRWLEAHGVKRGMSVAGVALILVAAVGTAGYLVGPRLVSEVTDFAHDTPKLADQLQERLQSLTRSYPQLGRFLNSESLQAETLLQNGARLLPQIGRYTLGFFGAIAAGFFIFVVGLYTAASPRPLVQGLLAAVPASYRPQAIRALSRIVVQLEAYVVATLTLMLIIGLATWIGLSIIGVDNALLFGVLAGLGEAVPTIGPILTSFPPAVVAFTEEPVRAVWVLGLFLVVQQLENNLLVPWIMARSLKLHPVSILFFVLALGSLLGILGALIAVPTAIVTKVLFEEFYAFKNAPDQKTLETAADRIVNGGDNGNTAAEKANSERERMSPPPAAR